MFENEQFVVRFHTFFNFIGQIICHGQDRCHPVNY